MITNSFGVIVWNVWKALPTRFPQISIDTAIVMPNHFHGIIVIHEEIIMPDDETEQRFPLGRGDRRKMTIPLIVGYFKMNTAKQINLLRDSVGSPVWQRNYYDRILRNDREYDSVAEYIFTNPARWGLDKD